MITKYFNYIKENKFEQIEFKITFSFNYNNTYTLDNICIVEFNIFPITKKYVYKVDRYMIDDLYKTIKNIITSLFKDEVNNRQYKISINESLYLILKLNSLNYTDEIHNFSLRKISRESKNLFSKILNLQTFKQEFQKISFKQEDMDNFFIEQINNNISLYNDEIYKYVISDKVKEYFKHLDNAKNFDLI